jgi:HK97 family phage major capsid protein
MPAVAPLTAKAIREQRKPVGDRIEQMRDVIHRENREFTAEERANWESANKEYESYRDRIEAAERAEDVADDRERPRGDRRTGRPDFDGRRAAGDGPAAACTEELRNLALQGWCRAQMRLDITAEHEEACRAARIDPYSQELTLGLRRDYRKARGEYRAMSAFSQSAGGYLVPEGFVNNLEVAMLQFNGPRQACDVMRTASGQDLPWPTSNDTSNKGALVTENVTVGTQDITVGQVMFKAYKYTSKLILVPAELLQDSAFDLPVFLGERCGERLGRIQADHFTFGTGAAQPTGIVTAATLGKTAASSTAIAADEVIQLKHSVDPAYRVGAGYMFHDNTLLTIKLLKDGVGRYLWMRGMDGMAPDTIDGDPFWINQSMASSIASGNKTALYGQMKKFKIRDVAEVRMRRLVERFADSDQEGFVAFQRCDSNLLDAGTHPIKFLQQP